MPVSVEVDDARRRVQMHVRGLVTYEDLAGLITYRRERGLVGHAALIDCDAAACALTPREVRALATYRQRAFRGLEVAPTAIVAKPEFLYGLFRMYQLLSGDEVTLRIARSRVEAAAWLVAQPAHAPGGR